MAWLATGKFARNFRWARIETSGETERQIVYEDFGA
jgi:hypothetical protein